MKKRWWFWFLVWTLPFLALTVLVLPILGLGLIGFFALYALLTWRRTGYTNRFVVYKEALKDPQPLAELALAGLLILILLLAAYQTPNEAFLVLIALVPLLAAMAFPDDGAKAFSKKRK